MVLENLLRKSCLAGRSRLSEFLQLYKILHPSAATSPSGTGSSRGETNLTSMGVVQCCELFLSQKLSNYCCRMRQGVEHSFRFFKSSLKIRRTTVFGMPSVSAINRDVTFRSSLTILSTAAMLSSVRLVVGRPLLSSSFTDSVPSRNRLCHSKIVVRLGLHHRKPSESVPQSSWEPSQTLLEETGKPRKSVSR